MPPRSSTCPNELEDLLIGAGERRAADLLKRVDAAIEKQSKLALGHALNEPEILPVPKFLLEKTTLRKDDKHEEERTSERTSERATEHQHASDSGIGSSLAESCERTSDKLLHIKNGSYHAIMNWFYADDALTEFSSGQSEHSLASTAVTRSFSGMTVTGHKGHCLSDYAIEQIHKNIIKPILEEPGLKEFHPLLHEVPRRIDDRDIANLRDLEKTLIFCAPVSLSVDSSDRALAYWSSWIQDFSHSPAAYLNFCERSIQCLHATVEGVHESDQCLPSDRPYTNHYFLDLVEQIRRYATILAATRAKQEKGEELDEMDVTPYVIPRSADWPAHSAKVVAEFPHTDNDSNRDEHIQLQGGMSHNGKPAELVRTKDGKTISIVTGHVGISEDVAASSTKRPMADDFVDDDGVRRSMARRKKNELPKTYTCKSAGCHKEFKRPCDLTKHIKTHDRPFKCPEEDCKYHEYGWPTEKECDRHVNDKHSDTPQLYQCLYTGCPYTSKRESNCKQHMEKSHGWEYVRSKSNGKSKFPVTRIPRASVPSTPGSAFATPPTPMMAPSPSVQSLSSGSVSTRGSMPPPVQAGPSTWASPVPPPFADFNPDFADHFNFGNFGNSLSSTNTFPITPTFSDDRRTSSATDVTLESPMHLPGTSFEDAMTTGEYQFKSALGNNTFGAVDWQQLTPASSVFENSNTLSNPLHLGNDFTSGNNAANTTISPHLSPGAQGDLTLTSGDLYDNIQMDEGFDGNFAPTNDFALYGTEDTVTNEPLFSGFDTFGSQFSNLVPPSDSNLEDLFPELKGQHF